MSNDVGLKEFQTVWRTFMKLFAMLTGDIQIEKFSQKRITIGVEPYAVEISPVIVEIAAMFFIFSMCTVVMFMLVSLTINRTEYFLKQTDIIRLAKTAYVCQSFEKMSGSCRCLLCFANCGYKTKRISKIKINLKPTQSFFNNFCLQFVYLHHGDIFEESSLYEASVIYEENLSATYYTPAWVIVKALEIENKRQEIKTLKKCKEEEAMKAAQLAANTRCNGRCRNF